jgi:hypothetical protein
MAKLTALVSLVLIALLGLAPSVSAESAEAEWVEVDIPIAGKPGGWQLAPGSDIRSLSLAIDGTLYAARVGTDGTRLMKSSDGGLSWTETDYQGEVAAIACPRLNTDTVYLSDGHQVFKSADGGQSFQSLSQGTLPAFDANEAISCLDIGYKGSHNPILFIGTADQDSGQWGGIYYLVEEEFGAQWTDMGAEGYDIYALACAPQFSQNHRTIALASDEAHSYVINNYGITGDWTERIELLKNNNIAFATSAATPIRFSPDFDIIPELFIGLSAGVNGGVYKVDEYAAYDMGPNSDITGLALGSDSSQLLAGGSGGQVWYSQDRGNIWRLSQKPPTGGGAVLLAIADAADSAIAYAATSGDESAFSISRDGGLSWNQVSLIDSEINDIVDLAPSPQYSEDGSLFMLTLKDGGAHSLWRCLDGLWERVFSSALPDVGQLEMVSLPPLYGGDNGVVLLAGVYNGQPSIWKSTDNGQSFSRRGTPFPLDAWAIIDDNSWFIGGLDGTERLIRLTVNSGLTYSKGAVVGETKLNAIVLSPNYDEDGSLLVGNRDGWVFFSEDNGQSFETLPLAALSGPLSGFVSLAFDPDYSTNNTVYAASNSAGAGIYRFIIGKSEEWKNIDSPAEGVLNQIVVSTEGTLYAANALEDGGMERCLNPTFPLTPSFAAVSRGLDEGAKLVGLWLQEGRLWSIDSEHNKLMSYSDSLTAPVILTSPPDGAPGVGLPTDGTVTGLSLDWETLEGATEYQWQLNYESDFSSLPAGFEGTTSGSSVHLPELDIGTSYYWRVRATQPVISPWSEKWSFTTSLGQTTNAPELYSPQGGAVGVAIEPIFQWSAIAGADSYELIVSTYATFDNPTILKTAEYALPATAWQCSITLNYDTTYYWKVRAVSADSYSAWSAVSAFSTGAEPDDLELGTVAEVPPDSDSGGPNWIEWLMPMGGIVLLVFLLVMLLMVIVMVVLVVKVSKL